MCLNYDKKLTKEYKTRFKQENITEIICYKGFYIQHNEIHSPMRNSFWGEITKDKKQTIRSDRLFKFRSPRERDEEVVNRGIHVYLDKKDCPYNHTIPVLCLTKDLVGIGNCGEQAVFMKITFNHNDIR